MECLQSGVMQSREIRMKSILPKWCMTVRAARNALRVLPSRVRDQLHRQPCPAFPLSEEVTLGTIEGACLWAAEVRVNRIPQLMWLLTGPTQHRPDPLSSSPAPLEHCFQALPSRQQNVLGSGFSWVCKRSWCGDLILHRRLLMQQVVNEKLRHFMESRTLWVKWAK